jgi:hypothetical protein
MPSATTKSPVVTMTEQLYKNISMGNDAILHLLPRVSDGAPGGRIKTNMTAALCYYEKLSSKLQNILASHGEEAKEEGTMAKIGARMGIIMNTAMDATDSHIAQMLIEGSTMAITENTKLIHQYENDPSCAEPVSLARSLVEFEERHIEALKQYL